MSSSSPDPGAASRRSEVLSRETDDGSFELILDTGEMRSVSTDDAAPPALGPPVRQKRSRWILGGAAAVAAVLLAGALALVFGGSEADMDELAEELPVVPGFRPYAGGASTEARARPPAPRSRAAAAPAQPEDEFPADAEEEAAWDLQDVEPVDVVEPRIEPEVVPPVEEPAEEEAFEEPLEADIGEPATLEDLVDEPGYEEEFVEEEPIDNGYNMRMERPDLQRLRQPAPALQNAAQPFLKGGVRNLPSRKLGPMLRGTPQVPVEGEKPGYDEGFEEGYDEPLLEEELYEDELPEGEEEFYE